ncbi:hypothetical protein CC86DRAFT_420288, partial [Ophiobolus disseminans]
ASPTSINSALRIQNISLVTPAHSQQLHSQPQILAEYLNLPHPPTSIINMKATTFLVALFALFATTVLAHPKATGASDAQEKDNIDALLEKYAPVDWQSISDMDYSSTFKATQIMDKHSNTYIRCQDDISPKEMLACLQIIIDTTARVLDNTVETHNEGVVESLVDTIKDGVERITAAHNAHIEKVEKSRGTDGDDVVLGDLFFKTTTTEPKGKLPDGVVSEAVRSLNYRLRRLNNRVQAAHDDIAVFVDMAFAEGKDLTLEDLEKVLQDKIAELDSAKVLQVQEL